MAYRELIGHFARVRAYMQHFYVYGFYTREEFLNGSVRAYDDERRRVEGWLGEYMGFRQTTAGKSVFLSFDSRDFRENPLFRALKSKSFTDRDVTLHFHLLDILADGVPRTVPELLEALHQGRLDTAEDLMPIDLSTLRVKVNEYESLGLLECRREGKFKRYRRAPDADLTALAPLLSYFAAVLPCGVVGSFLQDQLDEPCDAFRMKHHYITATLDSDVLCQLLDAICNKCAVTITRQGWRTDVVNEARVTPLYILTSTEDGRSYLAARGRSGYTHCRLDRILDVRRETPDERFDDLRAGYLHLREHCWGTSLGRRGQLHRISFTIRAESWETHIPARLQRERRCGQVESLPDGTFRFSADVYDPRELLPWIRTFIGRITAFTCTDERVTARFREDVRAMYALYGKEDAP